MRPKGSKNRPKMYKTLPRLLFWDMRDRCVDAYTRRDGYIPPNFYRSFMARDSSEFNLTARLDFDNPISRFEVPDETMLLTFQVQPSDEFPYRWVFCTDYQNQIVIRTFNQPPFPPIPHSFRYPPYFIHSQHFILEFDIPNEPNYWVDFSLSGLTLSKWSR